MTRVEMAKLFKLIDRYADARVAASWAGSRPPEEEDEILQEVDDSRSKLVDTLAKLED